MTLDTTTLLSEVATLVSQTVESRGTVTVVPKTRGARLIYKGVGAQGFDLKLFLALEEKSDGDVAVDCSGSWFGGSSMADRFHYEMRLKSEDLDDEVRAHSIAFLHQMFWLYFI